MRKASRWIFGVLLAGAVVAQFVGPARENPASDPAKSIHAQMAIPTEVSGVFKRSCRDCHTNDTRWPWYSAIAPVKWVLVRDVNEGREHMNLSHWAEYDAKEQESLLMDICKEVSSGGMPLPIYTLIHRGAKLAPTDVQALCVWTKSEAARMASGSGDEKDGGREEKHNHKH